MKGERWNKGKKYDSNSRALRDFMYECMCSLYVCTCMYMAFFCMYSESTYALSREWTYIRSRNLSHNMYIQYILGPTTSTYTAG